MNQEKLNSENWSEKLKIKAGSTVIYNNSYYISKNGINDSAPDVSVNFLYSGEVKKDESFSLKDASNLSNENIEAWREVLSVGDSDVDLQDVLDSGGTANSEDLNSKFVMDLTRRQFTSILSSDPNVLTSIDQRSTSINIDAVDINGSSKIIMNGDSTDLSNESADGLVSISFNPESALKYNDDYSSKFSERSLIDKGYFLNNTYTKTQDNEWRSAIEGAVQSGIKGIAKPNTPYDPITNPIPTPWVTGDPKLYEKYDIKESGIFPNFIQENNQPVEVTLQDLELNQVQIWVENGVSYKVLKDMPQATQSIVPFSTSTFPLVAPTPPLAPIQRTNDNAIWELKNGETSEFTDVPGISDKWINTSNDLLVRKSLEYFVNSTEPETLDIDSSLANWQPYLVNKNDNNYDANTFLNTLTVHGLSDNNKLYYHGRKMAVDSINMQSYATILGVKTNGSLIVLLDSIIDSDPNPIVDLEIDLIDIETIHVGLSTPYRSEVQLNKNNPNYQPILDSVKNYTDLKTKNNEKISKSLKTLIDDSALLKIDTNSLLWFKEIINKNSGEILINGFISLLKVKNISENSSLKYIGKKLRVNDQNEFDNYATILGKKTDNTLEEVLEPFLYIDTNPTIQEYILDITDYVELYILQSNPDVSSVQLFVDNPNFEDIKIDAVITYVDSKIKVVSESESIIIVNKLTNIDTIQRAIDIAYGRNVDSTIYIMPSSSPYEGMNDLFDGGYVRPKVSLIGIDKSSTVVLQEYGDYSKPPLQVNTNCYAENITFLANSNKGIGPIAAAYATHSDFGNHPALIEFFNCDFITESQGQTYGAGSWQNHTLRFRNCVFRKNNNIAEGSFYWHNKVQNDITNQKLEMFNCYVYSKGGATMQLQDANQTNGGNLDITRSQASVLLVGNTFHSDNLSANDSFLRNEVTRTSGALVGNIFLHPASHGNNITALNY